MSGFRREPSRGCHIARDVIMKSHGCNVLDLVHVRVSYLYWNLGPLLISEHVIVFDVESILTFVTMPHVADWLESPIGTGCIHNLRKPEAAAGTWKWTSHCSTFKTNWQLFVMPFRLAEIFCGGLVVGRTLCVSGIPHLLQHTHTLLLQMFLASVWRQLTHTPVEQLCSISVLPHHISRH